MSMNLTTRAARRGVAATAMIAAAILVPTAALATSGRSAAPAGTAAPKCATAALTAWMPAAGSGYAGGAVYELEISNTSARACTLYGFPGVSALGSNGHQLGSPASWDHAHPSRLLTLSPGATAHAVLRIVDVSAFGNPQQPCHPTKAAALRIIPPNDRTSIKIPFSFNACATPGPIYLSVRTTQSGAGIPNFSF
jgi:Protein of unknown function (DUF4232)